MTTVLEICPKKWSKEVKALTVMSALSITRKTGTAQMPNKGESMEACAKVDEMSVQR